MRPAFPAALYAAPLACGLMLASCGDAPAAPETVEVPLGEPAPAPSASAAAAGSDTGATPMADRVAVLGVLNKRNNVSEEISLKPGETRELGPVIITLAACERTAPWEMPQETGAFVQVDIRDRGQQQHERVFSGWLFRESPSHNVVEHPIYDVWVKDCTMRFPGEEAPPAPSASAPASAPAVSPAPSPAATPAATPAPGT